MTWDEFKAQVDAELLEEGVDGSIEIDYIDVSTMPRPPVIEVTRSGLVVWR